jgi:hypothetical protein
MRLLVLCLAAVMAPLAAAAQSLGANDKAAIVSVIEQQLDAFQRDDGGEAFSYASPMIQGMFGTPDRFMDMVRNGYPQVYRPQAYEFQGLDLSTGEPVQDVYMVGPDGEEVIARYTMERQPDGSWRINGCILTEAPGTSV